MSNIIDRMRLLFRKDKKPYLQLKTILGFYPHNIRLYQLALKHKSVAHFERAEMIAKGTYERGADSAKGLSLNNERLEYLGDAILGAVVADILYRHYGNRQEGFLTNLRSKIVCRKSLNQLAVKIGLDKLIKHTGAVTTGHNSFMNGNAFEAFFGAIYLDRGYAYCYRFMEQRVFKRYINVDNLSKQEENFKSSLIEWCQKYQYKFAFTEREIREGNTPKFLSTVCIENIMAGSGTGYSKKESDQSAAKDALRHVRKDKDFENKIKAAKVERLAPKPKPEPAIVENNEGLEVKSSLELAETNDELKEISSPELAETIEGTTSTYESVPAVTESEKTNQEQETNMSESVVSENASPKEFFSSNWD